MPALITLEPTVHFGASSIDSAAAVQRIGALLDATSLVHCAQLVLTNVVRALEAAGQFRPLAIDFDEGLLANAKRALEGSSLVDLQSAKTLGNLLPDKSPALSFFLSLAADADPRLVRTGGNLLCLANLTDTQVKQNRFKRLVELANAAHKAPTLNPSP